MILAIFLVVGITGNGLLLIIFVRHKEKRTHANSMLINLTAVDCVQLVINVLLKYLHILAQLKFSFFGCKLFYFFTYLLLAVSTYSVAMIKCSEVRGCQATAFTCLVSPITEGQVLLDSNRVVHWLNSVRASWGFCYQ